MNTLVKGFFRTFPRVKKSPKVGSHSGSELLPESSPSTLSAHQMATDERTSMVDANGHAWVRLGLCAGHFLEEPGYWASTVAPALGALRCPQIQFIDFVVVKAELEYIIMRQSTEAFVSFVCSFGFARALRTWKMVHYSPTPYIWQPVPWCLGVACGIRYIGFFREMTLSVAQCLV